MELFIVTFFAILGVLIGSFLNVIIIRYNTGKGIDGRSACMACSKKLKWYELVPVFSYLVQKGKCLKCKSSISKQYILVEAGTALLFALVACRILLPLYEPLTIITILNIVISLCSICLLIVIFVYDLYHKIIPDAFSYGFAFLALMRLALYYQITLFAFPLGILDFLAGPILALPFALIFFLSKGKWMGLGDAKLALGIGWYLGLAGGVSALCLAFWIGAVVSVGLLIYKKSTMKSEVPFAPFLILGLLIVYFFPMDIFHLYDLLQYAYFQ